MDHRMEAYRLVGQMTLDEKASLCAGAGFFTLRGLERLGLPLVSVADGPHGLRKQCEEDDHKGLPESIPATCFPTASAMACSFDRDITQQVGVALGEECRQNDVAILLGPGVNVKRSPLCGRNFEYFSEDPYLAGEMGTAWVTGVQSQKVGASLKHLAANSQERRRMASESVVDERALHEIYLSAFERVVREAHPWTVMPSYNKLRACFPDDTQGRYCCDNPALLTDILRKRWGFDGATISDWGAEDDRLAGIRAGLDIEMPYVTSEHTERIVRAVELGELDEDELDACAFRVVDLILKTMGREPFSFDQRSHHNLAYRAACESMVLLKNDEGLLPFDTSRSIAVIGALAQELRFQGEGSSKVNPLQVDGITDLLADAGISFGFSEGYRLGHADPDEGLVTQACQTAREKDIAVVFVGLADSMEAERFDRPDMSLPRNQVELIEQVALANPRTIVVLCVGAPVDMGWEAAVPAILLAHLGGEAAAAAVVDLLSGKVSPSGKLAETWPLRLGDVPSFGNFGGPERTVEYRESIFVGYRYYDTARKEVRYPFGYGLNYTAFEYRGLRVNREVIGEKDRLIVTVDIENIGAVAGSEVAQLYVALRVPGLFMAEQELKGFERVTLQPGEAQTVDFVLDSRSFSYYDTGCHDWRLAPGEQCVRIGSSSRRIRLHTVVMVEPDHPTAAPDLRRTTPCYFHLADEGLSVPDGQFEALYGSPLPARMPSPGETCDRNWTLSEVQDRLMGRLVAWIARRRVLKEIGEIGGTSAALETVIMESPLRELTVETGGAFSEARLAGLIALLNGHFWKGLIGLIKG